jgi:hypothetical protein
VRRSHVLFLALLTAIDIAGASTTFLSGNALLRLMNGSSTEQAIALGYVMGAFDAAQPRLICIPKGVEAGQVRDVVKKHLEEKPAIRQMEAYFLVEASLVLIWPCPSR